MNKKTPLTNLETQVIAHDYQQWREKFIITVLRIASITGVILIAAAFQAATSSDRILFSGLYVLLLAITFAPLPYVARAYSLLAMLFAIGLNATLAWGPWLDGSVFFLALIVMSALLFDNRAEIATTAISALTFIIISSLHTLGYYNLTSVDDRLITTPLSWISYTANFMIISIVIIAAINQFKQEFALISKKMQSAYEALIQEREQLEERVTERTAELENRNEQLRSSAIVARTVAEIQDNQSLMDSITRLTSEQFGYYHTGLYLLDEHHKVAFLQAASSSTGKQLLGQSFHIEPSRRNPMYMVVDQNRYHISSDSEGAQFYKDPNFPLTRSRISLPLTVHGKVIGILEIHSEQTQAFTAQDAEIMQTLADLAAISIDNTRLITETKNLVSQLETNTAFQARETWTKLTTRHTPAYIYTPAGVRPIFAAKKNVDEHFEGLKIPLTLHGQSIGVIRLRRKGVSAGWSERERDLVEKIAAQVSLALENSRLVDEAQKNAMRDKMIANISSRVRETLDVESVIRTATTELRRVFDLKEAEISVGFVQAESPDSKTTDMSIQRGQS